MIGACEPSTAYSGFNIYPFNSVEQWNIFFVPKVGRCYSGQMFAELVPHETEIEAVSRQKFAQRCECRLLRLSTDLHSRRGCRRSFSAICLNPTVESRIAGLDKLQPDQVGEINFASESRFEKVQRV